MPSAHRPFGQAQRFPWWLFGLALAMALFLLLPVLVILLRAAQPGWLTGLRPAVLEAMAVSARTSTLALLLCVVFGTPTALLLARFEFLGKAWLEALLDLPVVLPPVVAGLGLLLTFGRNGLLGPGLELAGVQLAFSPAAVVLAQTFVAAPYFVRTARAGFAAVERELEQAALVDGASHAQAFWRISWPLAWPSLLEGLVLSWTRALGEFGATILFAGSLEGRTRTMTLAVYAALESDLDAALVLAALMAVLAFFVLGLLRWAARRSGPVTIARNPR